MFYTIQYRTLPKAEWRISARSFASLDDATFYAKELVDMGCVGETRVVTDKGKEMASYGGKQ